MAREESIGDQFARFGLGKTPGPPPAAPSGPNGHGPTGPNPAYVAGAVDIAVAELSAMGKDTGRNHALNVAALKLGRYHDLDRDNVCAALLGACAANGLLAEDGQAACEATFNSGWNKGRSEPPKETPAPGGRYSEGSGVWIDPPDAATGGNGSGSPVASTTVHDFDPEPLEDDFWDRPVHRQIFEVSLGRMCAPWAILAYCAARALTMVRPCITLPPTVGSAGSLNWFAAIISASGGGKSIASDLAGELIPDWVSERNLGSGEGMVGQFRRAATRGEPEATHEAIMFTGDEGQTLAAMADRSGSDTMGTIRTGFSGGTLGHSYITKGRDFHLRKQTYRMTLVINIQPAKAGMLMHDRGGTPQRFMFFPGNDHRFDQAPDEDPFVAPLNLPEPGAWQYPRQLVIPTEAREAMREDRKARARGEGDPLDGHAFFCRAKLAFGLAVLDGRTEMTSEDWRLAGIAADVSRATRTWVLEKLAAGERDEAVQKGQLLGIAQAAAAEEKSYENRKRLNRVAKRIQDHLQTAGAAGMNKREICHKAVAHRDYDVMDIVLAKLAELGYIRFDTAQGRYFAV